MMATSQSVIWLFAITSSSSLLSSNAFVTAPRDSGPLGIHRHFLRPTVPTSRPRSRFYLTHGETNLSTVLGQINNVESSTEQTPNIMHKKHPQLEFRAIVATTVASLLLASTLLLLVPEPANANYGAAGGAVTSPAIVNSITLEEFLSLPAKKQRQYEGGFLSCKTVVMKDDSFAEPFRKLAILKAPKPQKKKICSPIKLGDELLKEIDELSVNNPESAEIFKSGADNLLMRQRLFDRKEMESKLSQQPNYINFGCAFLASCVSTLIVHPLDTLKVRLISGKGGSNDEDDEMPGYQVQGGGGGSSAVLSTVSSLYDGIIPNLLKEAPASALYLGIYESARTVLSTIPFFQEHILLNYLLAGSIGELVGSMSRSPAEAIKTRVQTGMYDVPGAIDHVFFTDEGRKNTFSAWFAGVFRDIPHGSIQIAVFEFSKILIVNSALDVDVNTLFSEALLGGFGGAIGAFVSTPSDVVTTRIITSLEDGGEPLSAQETLAQIWNEDGLGALFSGCIERVAYWTIAVGIFLSVYCSLRQYAVSIF